MTTIQSRTTRFSTTLLGITLGATLTACGGGSSSHGGGDDQATLPLSTENRALAFRSVTLDLWSTLNIAHFIPDGAFGWLADQCDEHSDLQEPDENSRSVSFTQCAITDGNETPTRTDYTAALVDGMLSQHYDSESGLRTDTFSRYASRNLGSYEEMEEAGGPVFYHQGWDTLFEAEGSVTQANDRTHFSIEQAALRYLDTTTQIDAGVELEGDYTLQEYLISDFHLDSSDVLILMINQFDTAGHVVRRVGDDLLALEFTTVTALERTITSHPCFTHGELHMTDGHGNSLNILFSNNEVTFMLNGVADTITCEAFASEMAL